MIVLGKPLPLWEIVLPLLALSNLVYVFDNIFGSALTLCFFLFVPGYLLLKSMSPNVKLDWGRVSLSIGLSVALITVAGLVLNTMHYFRLEKPLTTLPSFIALDILCLMLMLPAARHKIQLRRPYFKVQPGYLILSIILILLPLLAIFGAIRINNGASSSLTMIMMATSAGLIMYLMITRKYSNMYIYVILSIALAYLFANSLRGWNVVGHDIHHEYSVLYNTLNAGYWQARNEIRDPYNACLSITILPAILAKITTIPALYIFKVIFQIIFALTIPAIYIFFRKFTNEKRALLGVFAFMTFPTFTNDLPFLNRQEIAFMFFFLLIYVNFTNLSLRVKTLLTTFLMASIILAHYSSSYATIGILALALIFYSITTWITKPAVRLRIPLLSPPIILVAILATFAWNTQITISSANLTSTLIRTAKSVFEKDSETVNFASYNILTRNSSSQAPATAFTNYVSSQEGAAQSAPKPELPLTSLGKMLNEFIDVRKLNVTIHALIAKILQVMVFVGTIVLFFKIRKKPDNQNELYFFTVVLGCFASLIVFTLFPQLTVGYDITRLFQQSMIVLWLPLIMFAEIIFRKLGRYCYAGIATLLIFIYFNMAGFAPQLIGGFLPQLALNNSGLYYDFFFTHTSDIRGADWMAKNRVGFTPIVIDTGSSLPKLKYSPSVRLMSPELKGYLYFDHTNNERGVFRTFVTNGLAEYTHDTVTNGANEVYSNGDTTIFKRR